MTKARQPSKVYGVLVLAFLVLSFGMGIAGFIYYGHEKEDFKEQRKNELLAIADLKVRQIEKWREERQRDAEMIFNSPFIAREVEKYLGNPKGSEIDEGILSFMASLQMYGGYESVFLLDAMGRLKTSIPAWRGLGGPSAQSLISRVLNERKIVFSDLYRDEAQDRILMDLIVPVLLSGNRGNRLIGIILLRTDPLHFLYPLIQAWPIPSPTAESLLVRREGDEIVFLNELRHQRNTALILRLPMSGQDLPSSIGFLGKQGFAEGADYRGVKVLAAIQRVPDSPWILIAKIDQEEIFSSLRGHTHMLIAVVGLLILATGFIIASVWRQQLAVFRETQYKAELDRQALAKRYAYLAKYANDIIILYDSELRIVEANERAVTSYGYTPDELLQLTAWDLRPPETKATLDKELERVREQQSLVFETVQQRKDGTTFPVEVSVGALEVEGKEYYQSIIRDITERKQAEERLRRSEERFRDLFDNAPVGYHEFGAEGRITHVNRTELEMLGYRLEEMIGQPVWKFNVEGEKIRETILAKLSGKLPPQRAFERVLRRKEGTTVQVLIEDRLLHDEKGRIKGIRATIQDITERKKIEEEREKLIRELQEALAKVKTLGGLLPICASCKKIRDDKGYWNQIESYIRDHSEAEFSHGICPECMKKLYPDFCEDDEGKEDEIHRP